jgi:hypothetical protein
VSVPASALSAVEVANLLPVTVAALRTEVGSLPERVVGWHPAPDEWCVKDVIGHLIEAERRGFAGRIRIILSADNPTFDRWDPPAVARLRGDCTKPVTVLLDELIALRQDSVTLVRGLRKADLDRGGQHPAVGSLSVRDLLAEWVYHDRNHLRQALANVQTYVWPTMGNAQKFSAP